MTTCLGVCFRLKKDRKRRKAEKKKTKEQKAWLAMSEPMISSWDRDDDKPVSRRQAPTFLFLLSLGLADGADGADEPQLRQCRRTHVMRNTSPENHVVT